MYKVRDYLDKCVQSVLKQSFKDYELILVDDGCPDGGGRACDAYAEKHPERIQVIHQENTGLGGARNAGLKQAAGDYIFFVDSDDWIDTDSLQMLHNALEKYDYPHMALLGHVVETEKSSWKITPELPADTILSLAKNKDILVADVMAWARVVRREVYLAHGIFFPPRALYEDLCTTPKLLLHAERIVCLKECPYHYLRRGSSIMNSSKLERLGERIEAMESVLLYFKEQGADRKYRDELCFLAVRHIVIGAVRDVLRTEPESSLLQTMVDYAVRIFPEGVQNKYLSTLNFMEKRLVKKLYRGRISAVKRDYKRIQAAKRIFSKLAPSFTERLAK